jgi:hypothetical protein
VDSVPDNTPLGKLLARLPSARRCGTGWSARCPAHDDSRPSLTIGEGDDGRALVSCKRGCTPEEIVAALELTMRDLFPDGDDYARRARRASGTGRGPKMAWDGRPVGKPSSGRKSTTAPPGGKVYPTAAEAVAALERQQPHLGKHTARWEYHNEAGEVVGLVVRFDPPEAKKEIRPASLWPDGWRVAAMPDPRPLYGLPTVRKASRVVVTEGEKAADAARGIGFTATTSAGGSQAAGKTDWTPLAGKEVWVLPDADTPGRKYAEEVAGTLRTLDPPAVAKIVELPDLPEAGDLVDWIEAHGDAAEPDAMRDELESLADAITPAEPEPTPDRLDFRPFPVDALPEPIRGFVAAGAKAIGCDPSYLALPLLTSLAAAIGNTRRLQLKRGWYAPPILWSAIVGESGTTKTPAFKLVMRPVRERQGEAFKRHAEAEREYAADLARWEKEYTAWKRAKNSDDEPPEKPEAPQAERFVVSDATVEALAPILQANPRGLLLARDELAGWIGSFDRYAGKGKAGTDSANWLSMFSAETITVDRKTGVPRTIHVPQAAVCVTGGIQPGILQRALGDEHRESGLAARLLLACPPRKVKRWTEADIDPDAEAKLRKLFGRLFELQPTVDDGGEPRPALVKLTPEAKSAWVAYYNDHAVEQADLTGDLSAAWSKLEEYAARLALVLHFARWAADDATLPIPDRVDSESMGAAIRLTAWFKREALRVYSLLGETDTERDQRRLVEWIERRGGSATARDVQMGCRWLREPGAAEAELEALVKAGRGAWRLVPTTSRGGQPTRVFELSTLSTSTEPR